MSNNTQGKKTVYIGDSRLLSRVKQIVLEKFNNKRIDICDLSEILVKRFAEYNRRKRKPFEKSVEKAVSELIRLKAIPEQPEESDSFSDDNESYVEYKDTNSVNNLMTNLYKSSPKPKPIDKFTEATEKAPKETLSDNIEKMEDERPVKKKRKIEFKKKQTVEITKSTTTFDDVGGCEEILLEICKLITHIRHPEIYRQIGVTAPRGILLHGPPGCGKTLVANAIAGELNVNYIKLAATEIVSGVSGGSEERLREVFDQAVESSPSVLFLDEIDAVMGKRENASKEMERRIVSQLLTSLDDLSEKDANVLVIGATSKPDNLEPALRRAGRFDHEVCLGMPDCPARGKILHILTKNMALRDDVDIDKIAILTPGFVGADLQSVSREAALSAVHRELDTPEDLSLARMWLQNPQTLSDERLSNLKITMEDFVKATKMVQPSSKREGFATVPGVSWSDVGALHDIREELHLAIVAPVFHAEAWNKLGLRRAAGVLLSGPPGCGKTLLAKAVANEAGLNFLSVKGPELLNMYVGESERAVRQVFQRARNSAPCVIFFDEVDALCGKRGRESSESSARVVNQLLTELDGVDDGRSKGVYVLAATNRPDILDPALLRPGRLDKLLYVGLPAENDRLDILKAIVREKPPLADDVHLEELAKKMEYYSGADIAAVVREASVISLREWLSGGKKDYTVIVHLRHLEQALTKVKPSVSVQENVNYFK
ncbi:DgyrCDS11925 [Dimorphilus gyrociliatus]|uniref:DgyrCDS11925 n=1 Tax=Dimorphilus gyrociliatus TaxID=2664684 RepID=A0A7I8W8D9_9ANNE|nr:DgyrCDS11925 [Dimorphilus gyrociliatus]